MKENLYDNNSVGDDETMTNYEDKVKIGYYLLAYYLGYLLAWGAKQVGLLVLLKTKSPFWLK